MGTFSKVYIKNDNIEVVKRSIGRYYKILCVEPESIEQSWRFFQKGSDTMIVSNHYHGNWVEIILNYPYTLYYHDEFLRRLSQELNTVILLGYYQSTDGGGRLAKFEHGNLAISIIQAEVKYPGESWLRLMDNWGVTEELKKEFLIPNLFEEFNQIEWDTIYKFYKMNGLESDGEQRNDSVYYHLEIKYD